MKQFIILTTAFLLFLFPVRGILVDAQITSPTDNHTVREEAEGKEIWEKLQSKRLECKNLTDNNFESLGEYFMGRMMGSFHSFHEAMNNMMEQMMGKEGEQQMHVVTGKRLSGCQPNAQFPQTGFMPMIGMMGSGKGNMMGWGGGWGFFAILFWLFWLVILFDLILLGIWLWKKIKKKK